MSGLDQPITNAINQRVLQLLHSAFAYFLTSFARATLHVREKTAQFLKYLLAFLLGTYKGIGVV